MVVVGVVGELVVLCGEGVMFKILRLDIEELVWDVCGCSGIGLLIIFLE